MTSRERKLAAGVGLGGLLAAGAAVYLLVLEPLWAADAQAAQLQRDIDDSQLTLARVGKDRPRLADALARSLPADPTTAAVEYEATMSRLLDAADVSPTGRTLKLKASELKGPPVNPAETDAKKQTPAYTAVALEVSLTRIRYATLLNVLYRYHQLNLLHHITKFTVVRRGEDGARRSGAVNNDQPDLNVTFTTTALVMSGAENRRATLPVPRDVGGAAGGLGYALVQQSPAVARQLSRPVQFVRVLADPDRDYERLLATDMFHGPPPPPVPPPPVLPDPLKEETAAFIRLTGLGRNPDGTGSAHIEDAASKQEYAVEVTRAGGKLVPLVSKYYYTAKGAKKRLDDPDSTLDISESSSGTARLFRVVGLDDGGLVLVSREAKADSRKGPARSSKPNPAAAVAGSAAVSLPAETVYVWKPGEPLSKLKGLSARDGRQAVLRATGEPPDTVLTTAAAEDDPGR